MRHLVNDADTDGWRCWTAACSIQPPVQMSELKWPPPHTLPPSRSKRWGPKWRCHAPMAGRSSPVNLYWLPIADSQPQSAWREGWFFFFFFPVLAPSEVEIRLLMEKRFREGVFCVFLCVFVYVCGGRGVKPKMTFSNEDSQTCFDERAFPCNHMSLRFPTRVPTGNFHGFLAELKCLFASTGVKSLL